MPIINIEELMEVIKSHPKYLSEWKKDVPPEQALAIEFHKEPVRNLSSEVFVLKNGGELILDIDSEGIVCGIEII